MGKTFKNSMLCDISYASVERAVGATPYTMSLVGAAAQAVILAVNQQIDSHLEACFVPARGDSYKAGTRTIRGLVVCHVLECRVSAGSMAVLLRRLLQDGDDTARDLSETILTALGFSESGRLVGRDD
jgi:hypothetical protein